MRRELFLRRPLVYVKSCLRHRHHYHLYHQPQQLVLLTSRMTILVSTCTVCVCRSESGVNNYSQPVLEVVDESSKQDVTDVRLEVRQYVKASQEEGELDDDEADDHDGEKTVFEDDGQRLFVDEQQHGQARHLRRPTQCHDNDHTDIASLHLSLKTKV